MKKNFILICSLFIIAVVAISATVHAQSVIGSSCSEVGAKKKSCSGNTLVTIKCSLPSGCVNPTGSGCMNAQSGCDAECRKLDKCYSSGQCQPDPNLSGALQYSYVDEVYTNCINTCKDKVRSCYLACDNTLNACEKADEAKKEEYKKCIAQYQWEKYSETVCDSGARCVQNGDSASCEGSASPATAKPPATADDGSDGFDDYLKCTFAISDKYVDSDWNYCLYVCKDRNYMDCGYNTGKKAEFESCIQRQIASHKEEYDAANKECERKYGVDGSSGDASEQPAPDDGGVSQPDEMTLFEKADTLYGDELRDFFYGLSFDQVQELLTEANRQKFGKLQWSQLVRASEDIRRLQQNAFELGRRSLHELSLFLDSNKLASWERAVVNDAIERVKNKRSDLPSEDFFSEPKVIEDFSRMSRGDYAEENIKKNEEIARQSDLIEKEYKRIMSELNYELGMSPLRQGLLDDERQRKAAFMEADKPDPTYTGLDFEVPFDTKLSEDTPVPPPFISGRTRNPEPVEERFVHIASISNFEGRVYIVRTERGGSKTYETLRRVGTSIHPAVIFNDDKIIVGQDSFVDIMRPNGNENRYVAPDVGEKSTGDEINAEVKQIELQPPDPKSPPPNPILKWLGSFFERSAPEEYIFETPYGITGVKG